MTKHKIEMTTEECFEVVNILEIYVQRKNVDKNLLTASKNLKINRYLLKQEINDKGYSLEEISKKSKVLDLGCKKGFLLKDLNILIPGIKSFGIENHSYPLQL